MGKTVFNFEDTVRSEWVDYNGHMNDAEYAKVFSRSVDAFMDFIGLTAESRASYSYTMFTLETHICYLKEAHEKEKLIVEMQLLDSDAKRLHVFFTMKNANGDLAATSEQMLMGMDSELGKPAPFPKQVDAVIEELKMAHKELATPKQAGRKIGIKR